MPRKIKPKKKPRTQSNRGVDVRDAGERAIAEAAVRTLREARSRLRAAQDPQSSKDAYAAVIDAGDGLTRMALELAEADVEEEPDSVTVGDVEWRSVVVG